MNQFYQQYPAVELPLASKLVLYALYFTFVPFGIVLSALYFQSGLGEIMDFGEFQLPLLYFVGGLFTFVYLLGVIFAAPLLKKKFQKDAYLRQYGKKSEARCQKITIKKTILGTEHSRVLDLIISGTILTKTVIRQTDKNGEMLDDSKVYFGLKEGNTFNVIHNPYDPTDFVIDYKH